MIRITTLMTKRCGGRFIAVDEDHQPLEKYDGSQRERERDREGKIPSMFYIFLY